MANEQLGTQWPTESLGFIYGLIFARVVDRYETFGKKKWLCKLCISVLAGLLLGIAYLRLKPIAFVGDYILKILLGIALTNVIFHFSIKVMIGNKVSRFLGGISYEVYLLHSVVFSFQKNILPSLGSGLYIILALIITIISAALVKFSGEKAVKGLFERRLNKC